MAHDHPHPHKPEPTPQPEEPTQPVPEPLPEPQPDGDDSPDEDPSDEEKSGKKAPVSRRKKASSALRRFREIASEKETEEAKDGRSEEHQSAMSRLMHIRDEILTLKWDVEHGQINPAKKAHYETLKKEYDELVRKLGEPQTAP
ncbi:MAG TPA: hypothetical protein VJH22_06395 [Candidatus Nanoarchaeia archaeon]|nr:hypothetical protein [Candidatus Nanoarchaeia archaeon]